MIIAYVVLLAAVLLMGFVVLFGPPYLPTLRKNVDTALDLLDLAPGQTVLDLGCGDGRVLVEAAKRGANAVGIELSPLMFAVSWLKTWRYRNQVRVIWGNYFTTAWPPADAIFVFMIPRQMTTLDRKIEAWRGDRPLRLASFAFVVPDKEPVTQKDGVFLYEYGKGC